MSSTLMPVVFVSHGSPEIAVRETPAHKFLNAFASGLTQPKQILVVSAHWETEHPLVATGETPETIYDFGPRFDKRLWDITYDAPGAVDLARDAETLLREAGFEVGEDGARGRDHGVWTPLHLMFPARRIPVTQLSIQPALSPRHHFEIGRALRPLRERGVLILASGAITHNLSEFRGREIDETPPDWVTASATGCTTRSSREMSTPCSTIGPAHRTGNATTRKTSISCPSSQRSARLAQGTGQPARTRASSMA
jgi:4,5-DOPA dioxygenase extradiol